MAATETGFAADALLRSGTAASLAATRRVVICAGTGSWLMAP